MRTALGALILASLMLVTPAMAGSLRCDITARHSCSDEGCKPNQLGGWNVIDLDRKLFSRCDDKGCDHYDTEISISGRFYIIEIIGHGAIAKMEVDGSSYLEVTTLGTIALLSFWSCQ